MSGHLHDYMSRRDFDLFLHGAQVQMLPQKVDPRFEVEASSCYVALNLVLPGLGHPLAGRPSGMCCFVLTNHCSAEGLKVRQRYLCHALPARLDRMNLQISSQLVWTEFGSIWDPVSQFPWEMYEQKETDDLDFFPCSGILSRNFMPRVVFQEGSQDFSHLIRIWPSRVNDRAYSRDHGTIEHSKLPSYGE